MKFIARNLNLIGLLLLASFTAAAAGLYFGLPEKAHAAPAKPGDIQFTCPMHAQIVRNSAGDCPECGMKLVASRPGEELVEAKPAKGCCSSKPAAPAPATAMSCPHLASLTNSAPAGCCPHE
jgi:Heavy metal binding domain